MEVGLKKVLNLLRTVSVVEDQIKHQGVTEGSIHDFFLIVSYMFLTVAQKKVNY